jgi:hypothetical protein
MAKNTWGFEDQAWDAAKAEAKAVLADYARRRQMIPYSDFVREIQSITMEPHDQRLFHFLGEISEEEHGEGRGMLTALVVHKSGDLQPGPGFFKLAQQIGHEFEDIEKFWIQEVKRVFDAWADR